METPETRYAMTADDVSIAYQVVGSGSPDLVLINSSFTSNVDLVWEFPLVADVLDELAARGRLVIFDRRGTGLSDSVSGARLPTLEARVDDIRAVMDAAGSERAILIGFEDGAAQCFLFAATSPHRTAGVIAMQAWSRVTRSPDAPWLPSEHEWQEWASQIEDGWGAPGFVEEIVREIFPTRADDPEFVRAYWRLARHSLSRADAMIDAKMSIDTDVRHVLPTIQAPTLVLHNLAVHNTPPEESRFIASEIPGAVLAEFDPAGTDLFAEAIPHIDRFLASVTTEEAQFDRVLATVLFTDIVGSTAVSADIGDLAWRDLVERHHSVVRAMLGRYRGTEISTAGDGFFATFDGPARAVRCAHAIAEAVRPLGIEIRAGVHTGEVGTIDGAVGGIAVAIGARIGALAGGSEVLASSTVKDLTAGSGLRFEDAGEHELKGVPDRWRLYRVLG